MAWDLFNNAKTVVRGAAGVFYAPPYITLWEQAIVSNGGNPELSSNVVLNGADAINAAFQGQGINLGGSPLANLPTFTKDQLNRLAPIENRINNGVAFFFDPEFKLPRSLQFRVALEQEFARGITASFDYTQIGVQRIDRVRNLNLQPPTKDASGRPVYNPNLSLAANAALRPYPKYAFAYITEASARSLYRGFTATVNVARTRYTLYGTYTLGFSKSHDDHENGGYSSANYVDAYDLNNEYNWSNIDQRHQFAVNGVLFLPAGLELSGTMRANTGRPFSPRTGVDSNGDGIINDRPVLNGAVVRRNTFRNVGFSDTSLRVQKTFTMPNERGKLSASVEMFNLANSLNVEIGTAQFTYCTAATNPCTLDRPATNSLFMQRQDAKGDYIGGSPLRTTPFQVQLGLRYEF
jgi:hypothetical protein